MPYRAGDRVQGGLVGSVQARLRALLAVLVTVVAVVGLAAPAASAGAAAGVWNGVTTISPEPVTPVVPAATHRYDMSIAAEGGWQEAAPSRHGYDSALVVRSIDTTASTEVGSDLDARGASAAPGESLALYDSSEPERVSSRLGGCRLTPRPTPGRPDFVVHPNGAIGPTPVRSGSGFQFRGGSGGHGLDPRVTDVRIMDPVVGGKHPLPNGYVSYGNASGQTVNPWTGRTIDPADPWWHWEWSPP